MVEYRERVAVPRVAQFLISAAELEYLHKAEMIYGVELLEKDVATVADAHGIAYKVHKVKATIRDSRGKWARTWCIERTPKRWKISNQFEWLDDEPGEEDDFIWEEEA